MPMLRDNNGKFYVNTGVSASIKDVGNFYDAGNLSKINK
jgi:hypothetical protein